MNNKIKKITCLIGAICLFSFSYELYANSYATVTGIDGNIILNSSSKSIQVLQELNNGDVIEIIDGRIKIVFSGKNKEYVLKQKGIYKIVSEKNICINGKLVLGKIIDQNEYHIPKDEIENNEQGAFRLRSPKTNSLSSTLCK